jgi:hypothetical protein
MLLITDPISPKTLTHELQHFIDILKNISKKPTISL